MRQNGPYIGAMLAGALLAVLVTVSGVVTGSAARLEVDGGVLQTFTVSVPRVPDGAETPDSPEPEPRTQPSPTPSPTAVP